MRRGRWAKDRLCCSSCFASLPCHCVVVVVLAVAVFAAVIYFAPSIPPARLYLSRKQQPRTRASVARLRRNGPHNRCVRCFLPTQERGFVLLACTAFLFPPPTDVIATVVLGHLALHRTRNCPVGGLALYTHHHVSSRREAWAVSCLLSCPVLSTTPTLIAVRDVKA